MKKGIPVSFGYIPMGIAYAILAGKAGLTGVQTVSMSLLVFAGAGQIVAVSMLAQGATLLAIVATTFIINLRNFIMSACVINKAEGSSLPLNLLASFGVTDESFAIFVLMKESSIWTYLGLITVTFSSWVAGAAIGVAISGFLPLIIANSFNIALYALFVAIIVPGIKRNKRIGLLVIMTAILNFVLQLFIDSSASLIIATILGAFIGVHLVNDDMKMGDCE